MTQTNDGAGRVAVVTGANRGLGLETAKALAKRGYRVVFTARSQDKADAAIEGVDGEVYARALDVTDEASVDALFQWLDATLDGRVDVLVNNAGASFESREASGPLQVDAATLERSFRTNTIGPYLMMQQVFPRMSKAGFGRIVNVSSGMGGLTEMGGGLPGYRTSKASLNALTRVFHAETKYHGEQGRQIKVNAVCPGWVRTDMGGPRAHRSVEEGIAGIVWAATLPDDGPSGGFFRDGEPIVW